jgi:hypothetical protein
MAKGQGCHATLKLTIPGGAVEVSNEGCHRDPDCHAVYWIVRTEKQNIWIEIGRVLEGVKPNDVEAKVKKLMGAREAKGLPFLYLDDDQIGKLRSRQEIEFMNPAKDNAVDFFRSFRKNWAQSMHLSLDGKVQGWFMSDEQAKFLKGCHTWGFDGTFWISPEGTYQVWIVVGFDGYGYVPCAFFLLPDAKTVTYEWGVLELLYVLSKLDGRLMVNRIITDFEIPQIKGIRAAFSIFRQPVIWKKVVEQLEAPLATMLDLEDVQFRCNESLLQDLLFTGCLFHFGQAVFRWFRSAFKKGDAVYAEAAQILSLFLWFPYLERHEICALWVLLCETRMDSPEIKKFLVYFGRTWMSCVDWWRIRDPNTILTNDGAEVINRDLKRALKGNAHPAWPKLQKELYEFAKKRLRSHCCLHTPYNPLKKISKRRLAALVALPDIRKRLWDFLGGGTVAVGVNAVLKDALGRAHGIGEKDGKVAEKDEPEKDGKVAEKDELEKMKDSAAAEFAQIQSGPAVDRGDEVCFDISEPIAEGAEPEGIVADESMEGGEMAEWAKERRSDDPAFSLEPETFLEQLDELKKYLKDGKIDYDKAMKLLCPAQAEAAAAARAPRRARAQPRLAIPASFMPFMPFMPVPAAMPFYGAQWGAHWLNGRPPPALPPPAQMPGPRRVPRRPG